MLKFLFMIPILVICMMASIVTSFDDYDPNVVWRPIKGSSQEIAIDSRADITFYYGTRGPGKTSTQLMFFRKYVGIGYGKFLKGILFDREFKHLADVVAQAKRFFLAFGDCKFNSSTSEYKFVWDTGEELLFRHAKKLTDYDTYHGHEYPIIMYNEICKWPTLEFYDKMMSTNRSSFTPRRDTPRNRDGGFATPDGKPLPNIPLKVFITGNPNGPGHNAVKRRFISCCSVGTVFVRESEVFNPRTQKEEIVKKTQIAIFGSYKENVYLAPEYIATLHELTRNNENLRKSWLEGSWDHNDGGFFDSLWNSDVHVIDRFPIPSGWRIDRSGDWGSSHPFSIGWWAEANGEEVVLDNGEVFCPVRGSLIQIYEWYGSKEIGTNKGLKLSPQDLAYGITDIDNDLNQNGWISGHVYDGPMDNNIENVTRTDIETIKKTMSDCGVNWTKSDKSPGSRTNGFQLFRDRLENASIGEGKAIYFMRNCVASIETIPNLPRDDEKIDDIDTSSEDHCADMVRYRILSGNNRIVTKLNIEYPQ